MLVMIRMMSRHRRATGTRAVPQDRSARSWPACCADHAACLW